MKNTKKINFDITDEQHEWVRQAAKAEGVTIKAFFLASLKPLFKKHEITAPEKKSLTS